MEEEDLLDPAEQTDKYVDMILDIKSKYDIDSEQGMYNALFEINSILAPIGVAVTEEMLSLNNIGNLWWVIFRAIY